MVEPTMIDILNAEEDLRVFVRTIQARVGDMEAIIMLRELAEKIEEDAE